MTNLPPFASPKVAEMAVAGALRCIDRYALQTSEKRSIIRAFATNIEQSIL